MQDEAQALIVARKNDLLSYIQTVCRDHVLWGGKVIEQGWSTEFVKASKVIPRRDVIGRHGTRTKKGKKR